MIAYNSQVFFMQLLKFCLLRQVQLKVAGTGKGPTLGKSPRRGRVTYTHTHRHTNENIFAQFIVGFRSDARMGPKWGTSARRVLREWEVREVPVKVLVVPVLGKSADCWRRDDDDVDDRAHGRRSSDRTWARSKLMVRVHLPNRKIAKLRNWNSRARVYFINMNNDLIWFVYATRRDKMRSSAFQADHMIVTRASMGKLLVVFHFLMRSIRECILSEWCKEWNACILNVFCRFVDLLFKFKIITYFGRSVVDLLSRIE